MFIAALFVIAKTWKQPRCPSTEEWIKKMWHIHAIEYFSAVKSNDMREFKGKWMELEKNHSERGNPNPERQTRYVLTHKWILAAK